eukprot:2664890-Pyramimonas_sp.AAC.1
MRAALMREHHFEVDRFSVLEAVARFSNQCSPARREPHFAKDPLAIREVSANCSGCRGAKARATF